MKRCFRDLACWSFICALSLPCAGQSAFNINYQAIRNSVVFIYVKRADGQVLPDGTAFMVAVPSKSQPSRSYVVLVTARHMVDPRWTGCSSNENAPIVARLNKKEFDPKSSDIGTVDYDLSSASWITPDDSVDLAYAFLDAAKLETLDADVGAIPLSDFPKPNELKAIDTGSQIMSAGLFPGVSGTKRNYPIFKFGYVSSRPDEKVSWKDCPNGNELLTFQWMLAASLVSGNSGSPVFFVPVGFGGLSFGGGRAVLIGVQSNAVLGFDIAGMAPIQFLIDSLKTRNVPDADFSAIE